MYANGDQTSVLTSRKKRDSYQRRHHRRNEPRGHTFTTTRRTLVFPTCLGAHDIKYCKVFKAKSTTKRLKLAKRASLCTNCLSKGHSITQCFGGSCRTCGQRHHSLLHREPTHVSSRVSCGRSSSGRSSGGRSSSGRSSSTLSSSWRSSSGRSSDDRSSNRRASHGSTTSHSSRQSRRTTESKRKLPPSSPQGRKSLPQSDSRSSRTKYSESNSMSNPTRSENK